MVYWVALDSFLAEVAMATVYGIEWLGDVADDKSHPPMAHWLGRDPVTGHNVSTAMTQASAIERLIDRVETDRQYITQLFEELRDLRGQLAELKEQVRK